jgi:hypothetical protein
MASAYPFWIDPARVSHDLGPQRWVNGIMHRLPALVTVATLALSGCSDGGEVGNDLAVLNGLAAPWALGTAPIDRCSVADALGSDDFETDLVNASIVLDPTCGQNDRWIKVVDVETRGDRADVALSRRDGSLSFEERWTLQRDGRGQWIPIERSSSSFLIAESRTGEASARLLDAQTFSTLVEMVAGRSGVAMFGVAPVLLSHPDDWARLLELGDLPPVVERQRSLELERAGVGRVGLEEVKVCLVEAGWLEPEWAAAAPAFDCRATLEGAAFMTNALPAGGGAEVVTVVTLARNRLEVFEVRIRPDGEIELVETQLRVGA